MAKAKASTYPLGILAQDLAYPSYADDANKPATDFGEYGTFTLHKTERFGWCIATLFISRGKRGQPDRTYGISIDGKETVSIGNGPHVTETIRVHVTNGRKAALQPLQDLYVEGLKRANDVRDRRSSRIAKGQEMRAAGRTRWRWDE